MQIATGGYARDFFYWNMQRAFNTGVLATTRV